MFRYKSPISAIVIGCLLFSVMTVVPASALSMSMVDKPCTKQYSTMHNGLSTSKSSKDGMLTLEGRHSSSRRSLLLGVGSTIVATSILSSPSIANAEGSPPPPKPPAPPAPAPPKSADQTLKEKAETEAKKKVDEEIAKEAKLIREQAITAIRAEYKQELAVEKKKVELKEAERKYKSFKEARVEAEKIGDKLKSSGDIDFKVKGVVIDRELKSQEEKQSTKVKKLIKEQEIAESKLKNLKVKRLELAARYKIKTGKEISLPPPSSTIMNMKSSKGTGSGVDGDGAGGVGLIAATASAIAVAAIFSRQTNSINGNSNLPVRYNDDNNFNGGNNMMYGDSNQRGIPPDDFSTSNNGGSDYYNSPPPPPPPNNNRNNYY